MGEDVSHGPTGLVEEQVEAIGVNLRTVGDFKHRLEANSFLSCDEQRRGRIACSIYLLLTFVDELWLAFLGLDVQTYLCSRICVCLWCCGPHHIWL